MRPKSIRRRLVWLATGHEISYKQNMTDPIKIYVSQIFGMTYYLMTSMFIFQLEKIIIVITSYCRYARPAQFCAIRLLGPFWSVLKFTTQMVTDENTEKNCTGK